MKYFNTKKSCYFQDHKQVKTVNKNLLRDVHFAFLRIVNFMQSARKSFIANDEIKEKLFEIHEKKNRLLSFVHFVESRAYLK